MSITAILKAVGGFLFGTKAGKGVLIAIGVSLLLLAGKCAWDARFDAGVDKGAEDVRKEQTEKQNEAIRKGADARRDAGSGSNRDERLRERFRRPD